MGLGNPNVEIRNKFESAELEIKKTRRYSDAAVGLPSCRRIKGADGLNFRGPLQLDKRHNGGSIRAAG
jgi:hypothetical protein